jgi:transposase-like protein
MKSISHEPEAAPSPTICPFCRSPKIMTVSDKVDSATYWRCEGCGDVWNVARLRPTNRRGYEVRRNDY